jgi:hypothetical protein
MKLSQLYHLLQSTVIMHCPKDFRRQFWQFAPEAFDEMGEPIALEPYQEQTLNCLACPKLGTEACNTCSELPVATG